MIVIFQSLGAYLTNTSYGAGEQIFVIADGKQSQASKIQEKLRFVYLKPP